MPTPPNEAGSHGERRQKQEIDDKVTALVTTRFGGDDRAAFAHYDADGNGTIDNDELKALLKDAGIGSGLTRWAWAKGIMGEVDTSGTGASRGPSSRPCFKAVNPDAAKLRLVPILRGHFADLSRKQAVLGLP